MGERVGEWVGQPPGGIVRKWGFEKVCGWVLGPGKSAPSPGGGGALSESITPNHESYSETVAAILRPVPPPGPATSTRSSRRSPPRRAAPQ